jgi:hypothetical protein
MEERNMKMNTLAVVLLILFFGGIIVPPAGAEDGTAPPGRPADVYFDWASERGGEEVTAAECIQRLDPGYWSSLSDAQKESFANIRVELPDFTRFEQNGSGQRAVAIAYANQSMADTDPIAGIDRGIGVFQNRYIAAIPSAIAYWAGTAHHLKGLPSPFPALGAIADLVNWGRIR